MLRCSQGSDPPPAYMGPGMAFHWMTNAVYGARAHLLPNEQQAGGGIDAIGAGLRIRVRSP